MRFIIFKITEIAITFILARIVSHSEGLRWSDNWTIIFLNLPVVGSNLILCAVFTISKNDMNCFHIVFFYNLISLHTRTNPQHLSSSLGHPHSTVRELLRELPVYQVTWLQSPGLGRDCEIFKLFFSRIFLTERNQISVCSKTLLIIKTRRWKFIRLLCTPVQLYFDVIGYFGCLRV